MYAQIYIKHHATPIIVNPQISPREGGVTRKSSFAQVNIVDRQQKFRDRANSVSRSQGASTKSIVHADGNHSPRNTAEP